MFSSRVGRAGNLTKGYLYNVKDEALFTKVKESSRLGKENGFMIMSQKKKKKKKNYKFARVIFTD